MTERFTGNFTQQEPIPDEGIEAAMEVLRHGRLHRYNVAKGETAHAALLEQKFAAPDGIEIRACRVLGRLCDCDGLARGWGFRPGDRVLTNAFTLAPVPGCDCVPLARSRCLSR